MSTCSEPLLSSGKSSDIAGELPPMFVAERTGFAAKLLDLVYSRITHYWIALIAQTCHLVLCAIEFWVVATIEAKASNSAVSDDYQMLILATSWSVMAVIILVFLIMFHYKKALKLRNGTRFLAGHHVACAKICVIMNASACAQTALPYVVSQREFIFEDNIRPVIIPLMIGFLFVASGACFTAGRITYSSAVSARGTESVPDPDYRVPAWTLATTDESRIYHRSGGSVKLAV